MGCKEKVDKECDDDEKPGRRVYLDAFHIDKFGVTVAEYRSCGRAGNCEEPGNGPECNWEPERNNHPINCVS